MTRNELYRSRHYFRWLRYGERRYIHPPVLIDLKRGSGCPTEGTERDADASQLIRAYRRQVQDRNEAFIDLWWKTRGYRLVD